MQRGQGKVMQRPQKFSFSFCKNVKQYVGDDLCPSGFLN